ncbi:MAG: hypothetical protein JWP81_5413 [Ferruginibacter sp.]|nr:hypothetical protein [Ferruginibacter sp.]
MKKSDHLAKPVALEIQQKQKDAGQKEREEGVMGFDSECSLERRISNRSTFD